MQKKFSFFRIYACVLLLSFSATLIPVAALAETSPLSAQRTSSATVEEGKADLSYLPELASQNGSEKQEVIVIAALDATDRQAVGSVQQRENSDCCGGFWEIHFGGYRWAWWALAGAGLIAIHSD
ncbi:MAG: hypothetical protein CVU69_00985 [Deltaproteobacteria bacterium HGW-Deltaproteobacteria-4]|nr:MAG: hypothetical protein CVU69_00985 [Deltaproteobacteria bacterium HGW-Deltaproteobacteria-4]